MSPRPLPPETVPFEPALALAREGLMPEAIFALHEAVRVETGRGQRRSAGALAFAQVAKIAETAGDLDTAVRAIDAALELAPDYADLHFRRGCLMLARQQRAPARVSFDQALRINPKYVAAQLERALLDAREGFLGEALAALRALDEERRVEEPRTFQQGLKSLERADWEEAGALLKSALQLSDPVIDELLAHHHVLMQQGEYARALQSLRDSVTTHPGYPDLHYQLGCCELEAGLTDDAIGSLARALELNPDYHAARIQFARALENLGDLAQAGEQVALVLQADPMHVQALDLQARWARRRAPARSDAGARKVP
jgi:tetratricopeptide (TPR) repeat protein